MYKWSWKKEQVKEFLEAINKDRGNTPIDFIGAVRTGNICFDIIEREADGEYYLWADLYVGGIDSGYGHGLNNYPYDFIDHINYVWNSEEFQEMDVVTFKTLIEEKLDELINNSKPICFKDTQYSLIDKANEQLKMW